MSRQTFALIPAGATRARYASARRARHGACVRGACDATVVQTKTCAMLHAVTGNGASGTAADWPRLANHTHDGTLGPHFARLQAQWAPTEKINTHENIYHHMLQLRTVQPVSAHGHVGTYPIQTFKVYWLARLLTDDKQLSNPPMWPITCEVGFGTGMSTAIFATATSSPSSSLVGGTHHIFDCRYCQGSAGGKTPGWDYLSRVFGQRLQYHEGYSDAELRKFAQSSPQTTCDMISIDGAHLYPQVLLDIRAAHPLAHKETVLIFDDYQLIAVNRSISEAIDENLIRICEVYTAESGEAWDRVFASNRMHAKSHAAESAQRKVFVVAQFVTSRMTHARSSKNYACGRFRSRSTSY